MKRKSKVISNRVARHRRIRKKIMGTAEKPRLCIFRSLKHMEAQLIDDLNNKTMLSVSTRDKDIKGKIKHGGNVEGAKQLGAHFADKAKEMKLDKAVFDRAGYLYHGRVKAFADTARENGIKI